jgi:hypothetical protein
MKDEQISRQSLAAQQKQLEDTLQHLGFRPPDEWEEGTVQGRVLVTKYGKPGLGVRVERTL